jgi:hypothetical protein
MEKTFNSERSFTLDFTEENFPGWEVGNQLPNPYTHTDGDLYEFSGSAVVDEVQHQVGATITVTVTHHPEVR